jgi:outer membrane protein assembly factor BamB/tetratricopeptide (TPR) repeat protein
MVFALFCPQCDSLLLDAAVCPACGWRRPRVVTRLGAAAGEPVPLGSALSGAPAQFDEVVWYAAPPASPESAGALVALRRRGSLVRRHELEQLVGAEGLPVATGVVAGGGYLFPALLDYAFAAERGLKTLVALEPYSGQIAWQLPSVSRELSVPTVTSDTLFVAGASAGFVYAVSIGEARLLWQAAVPADQRYQPVVAGDTVAVVAGALTGDRSLEALDRESGAERWRAALEPGAGQPEAASDLIFVAGRERLVAYDAATGAPRWDYAGARVTSRGIATAPLVAAGDLLLLPAGASDGDARGYGLVALELASGTLRWQYQLPPAGGRIKVAPAVFGSTVVVGNSAGLLLALELATGELLWQGMLPQRLAAVPALVENRLLLPGRDGQLFRLRWQESDDRPLEEPALYEAAGDWEQAAVAHALADPPQLVAAGSALLRADQPERALKLFQAAGDEAGAAEALARLGRLEEALALLPAAAGAQRAAWHAALGHHDQAGEIYAGLEDWAAAGAAFEAAHRPLKAVRAYHYAGMRQEVLRLAAALDLEAVTALVDVLGWEAAVARYREAGRLDAAADLLEAHQVWDEALALRRQQGDWNRVREICHQLGDWEGEAEACLQLAEILPRREAVVAAPNWAPPDGLPELLYERLRQALLRCEAFASDATLAAAFVDGRIAPWRQRVVESDSVLQRVESAIALLHSQSDRDGRNALALLLQVLGERTGAGDALRDTLLALADELVMLSNAGPRQQTVLLESPAARQWRAQAGELYAAHEHWAEAERCFQAAGHVQRWAEAVARQGRWEEAGNLLTAQKIGYEQAAAYYWEAAVAELAALPAWERRAPTAAALFQKAQECFLFSGNLEGLLICRTEADRCLLRPRLVLGEGALRGELQQGVTSQFTLPLYNVGFGPASGVELYAYGSALKRPRSRAVWAGSVPLVAANGETEVTIAVEPSTAGHEETPLQIKLLLRYEDVRNGLAAEDGPFEIHQPVLPAAATAHADKEAPIRPHHQGYYFDNREQVEIARAARGLARGERNVSAVLETMPPSQTMEQEDG